MVVKENASAVEIQSPCSLPLGLALADGKPGLLGVTLLYPPIQMLVKPHNELSVTGARANIAREQAMRWFAHHDLPPKAEIEIELAIPAYMGLGSEAMMGMSVARGLADLTGLGDLAGLNEVGLDSVFALEVWSHAKGGLIVTGWDGTLIGRREIQHDDQNAWVFVIHLPHTPKDTPPSFETDRRRSLMNAAQHAEANIEPLWSALANDDIASFGRELMAIQTRSYEALAEAGTPVEVSGEAKEMLEVIRTSGAAAWGQSFGGLATWGLIKGAGPSQEARIRMRRLTGYEGGTVTAAIADNQGARIVSI